MTHFRDVRLRENGAYTFLHSHHIRSDGLSGIPPDPQPQFDEGTKFRRASKIWPQTISFEPSAAIMRWYNEENNPMQWDADEESGANGGAEDHPARGQCGGEADRSGPARSVRPPYSGGEARAR
ncbi:MAG: hypothetical protein M1822_004507 [Bathelium mastoideum]|nr:MAG: hypothetical protein M1822_004507 [Bathelium mastoideum]